MTAEREKKIVYEMSRCRRIGHGQSIERKGFHTFVGRVRLPVRIRRITFGTAHVLDPNVTIRRTASARDRVTAAIRFAVGPVRGDRRCRKYPRIFFLSRRVQYIIFEFQ